MSPAIWTAIGLGTVPIIGQPERPLMLSIVDAGHPSVGGGDANLGSMACGGCHIRNEGMTDGDCSIGCTADRVGRQVSWMLHVWDESHANSHFMCIIDFFLSYFSDIGGNLKQIRLIFYHFFTIRWHRQLKSILEEAKDLFILSQSYGCCKPGLSRIIQSQHQKG